MSAIAKGFAKDIKVAEEVFAGFARCPVLWHFWRATAIGRRRMRRAGHSAGPHCRILRHGDAARVSPARRAGRTDRERLHEAGRAGCEYAVVSTNPGSGSQRNMERRGFRVAYTKVVMMRSWPEAPNEHGH